MYRLKEDKENCVGLKTVKSKPITFLLAVLPKLTIVTTDDER